MKNENNCFKTSKDAIVINVQELWSDLLKINWTSDLVWVELLYKKKKKQLYRTFKTYWENISICFK